MVKRRPAPGITSYSLLIRSILVYRIVQLVRRALGEITPLVGRAQLLSELGCRRLDIVSRLHRKIQRFSASAPNGSLHPRRKQKLVEKTEEKRTAGRDVSLVELSFSERVEGRRQRLCQTRRRDDPRARGEDPTCAVEASGRLCPGKDDDEFEKRTLRSDNMSGIWMRQLISQKSRDAMASGAETQDDASDVDI